MSEVRIKVTPKVLTVKLVALRGLPAAPTQEQINTAVTEYMDEHPESQIPDGSVSISKLSSDVAENVSDVPNKADQTGSYPDLIAGTADNLLSSSFQTDRTPYIIRRAKGAREKGSIVGGSLVWNQIVKLSDYESTKTVSGITFTNNGDGSVTANGTAEATVTFVFGIIPNDFMTVGHKYLISSGFTAIGSSTTFELMLLNGGSASNANLNLYSSARVYNFANTNLGNRTMQCAVRNGATVSNLKCTPQLIDLTLMFGSTIADYIYTQEQATAGAGVALAKAWAGITEAYIPYNAGSIKSVTGLTAHKMTGFNQWDEEWEVGGLTNAAGAPYNATDRIRSKNYCDALPSASYYLKAPNEYIAIYWYDANKVFIRANISATVTSPDNARFFKITLAGNTTTYNNDICVNISDPQRNGQYEPYKTWSYPLDSSLTLRGLPKLDGDNIYYDGDIYNPSGEGTLYYGVHTILESEVGTPTTASTGAKTCAVTMSGTYKNAKTGKTKLVQNVGDFDIVTRVPSAGENVIRVLSTSRFQFYGDGFTDLAAAKQILVGKTIVYELNTPEPFTAEPYTALQICDPAGTEEFVGASMPVGHETKYYADLKGKLEDIPDAPSADGTYTLKVTVSNGVATYSWE